MKKIFAIAHKELGDFFKSPIAYIVLIITISVFNIFFFMIIDQNREADLREVFKVIEFMCIFFIPLLTMKVFSEENICLGEVTDIESYAANDLIAVQMEQGETFLVPVVKDFIKEINLKDGKIIINVVEGLLN